MFKWLLSLCLILVLGVPTIASADLLVHYKFDETADSLAVDASGNGFDGMISGGATWVEGYMDGALQFTGENYVTLPSADFELYSDVGSVTFWINADVPTGIYTMFWGGDNTTGTGFGPENEMHVHLESAVTDIWQGGELSFYVIADPSVHLFSDPAKGVDPAVPPVSPILLGDLEWHHVAATWYAGGMMKLYIDGEMVVEAEFESTGYDLTYIYIGQMAAGNRRYIGLLDDFRLYSNALTDEEVLAIALNQTAVSNSTTSPHDFMLKQNYPNPFNPTTTISYQLEKNSDVLLTIYNQAGQKVRTLVQDTQGAGFQSIAWDGRDDAGLPLSSGIYLYRLQADDRVQTKKMMLLK